GRKWLERALAVCGDRRGAAVASALFGATYLARSQGDYDSAKAFAEKGMAIARQTNNQEDVAWYLYNLGVVALHEGDASRGKALVEESVTLGRQLALHKGDPSGGKTLVEESVTLRHQLGLKRLLAWGLAQLGHIARDSRDYERATTFYAESLAFAREEGEK